MMPTGLCLLFAAIIAICCCPVSASKSAAQWREAAPGMVQQFTAWDYGINAGGGYSDRKTSGGLAWGEASFLRSYMHMYAAVGDEFWLHQLVDHFDRMLSHTHRNQRGFRVWDDIVYSVGIVKVVKSDGGVTVVPAQSRVYYRSGGKDVTGHRYQIQFPGDNACRIVDLDTGDELASIEYRSPLKVQAIPGVKLTLTGTPRAGETVDIETVAPQPCEFQVHDGMIGYPVAQFIEAVKKDDVPEKTLRAKADAYLQWLLHDVFEKWEPTWRDTANGAGLYLFSSNPTQRFPSYSLPHNQYLALARVWLVLADLPGLQQAPQLRERATRMAREFRRHLRLENGAYIWNYWDPLPGEAVGRHIEDISHATIDISFAVEAAERGVVFTTEDLDRFAATLTQVMWNGDEKSPKFGGRVDTRNNPRPASGDWWLLAAYNERVWELLQANLEHSPSSSLFPLTLRVMRQRGLLDEDTRQRCRVARQETQQLVVQNGIANASFEIGRGEFPLGWTLTRWTPDAGESVFTWSEGGHTGKLCLRLEGRGEPVNVLAQQAGAVEVTSGERLTIRVFYRTQGAPKPHISLLGYDESGKRLQYDTSPSFPATETWRAREWKVVVKPGVVQTRLLLRNSAAGVVWFDDVSIHHARDK